MRMIVLTEIAGNIQQMCIKLIKRVTVKTYNVTKDSISNLFCQRILKNHNNTIAAHDNNTIDNKNHY